MPFVVDASVAVCWFIPNERHPISVLWWYEIRNVLMVNERRGRLDNEKTARVLRLLRGLPVAMDTDVEEEALMQLARRHRLTVYDAAYLELALRKGYRLATLGAALANAARAEGVPLLG